MKKTGKKKNDMFPINYNEKLWEEKDCNDVFLAFYNCPLSLNNDCSVNMMGGDIIFPDGTMCLANDDDDDDDDDNVCDWSENSIFKFLKLSFNNHTKM